MALGSGRGCRTEDYSQHASKIPTKDGRSCEMKIKDAETCEERIDVFYFILANDLDQSLQSQPVTS